MDEMSLVVLFAKLWGMEVADSRSNKEKYTSMEAYDSEELLDLLCSWKKEYINDEDADDPCEFFYKKIKLLYKNNL